MNQIKSLGGQTIVYGLSSIVPKFLSYLLNPLYTYNFDIDKVGQFTILYTYVIFLNIVLTYGMETGFFYFSKKEKNTSKVFGTAFYSLLITTTFFVISSFIFLKPIAEAINFSESPRYIMWFICFIAFDTLSAIPFAKLRSQNKAFRFALIKLIGVGFNVFLNVMLIWIIPNYLLSTDNTFLGIHYTLSIEIIFISNFISSLLVLLILLPEIVSERPGFNMVLLKQMLIYSLPLMVAGFAGTINDALDRILLQYWLPKSVNALQEIGIYGANIKLAVLMTLFIQMFRFAAEPFFFNQHKSEDMNQTLADVTKYFILFGLIIFLGVISYIDILKYFVGDSEYWVGLKVVPIYLLANLCLGIYFNLSFWYKLSGKTYYGIIITLIGSFISVTLNILLIPVFSYFGCAIIHLVTYLVMIILSYYWGKKHVAIPYDFKKIFTYILIALVLFVIVYFLPLPWLVLNLVKNTIALILFLFILEKREHLFSLFLKK